MKNGFTRRGVLGAGLAVAGGGGPKPEPGPTPPIPPVPRRRLDPQPFDQAVTTAFAPEAVAYGEASFPQTVASGAMRERSVILWTRASGLTEVTLRVWRDVSATEVALVKSQVLPVGDGGHVKVAVDGLAPGTWYRYAFFDAGFTLRSQVGQVRTAFPEDWLEPLVVGATSCASYKYRPFAVLSAMGQQPMDFWVHLGDVSYNDGAGSLDEYRTKWNAQLADPGYRALMPNAGGYLTWDDHDFENNLDPEVSGATPQVAAAKTAWFETLPVERFANDRIWTSYRWGRTAEFFVLDTRMERLPSTRETPQAQYVSRAQMDWLKAGLKASACHFKVVCHSVPITTMPGPLWGGQGDRWQGYPAAREELLGFLDAEDLQNVWFLAGDFHVGLLMRVEKTGPRRRLFEVAAGPIGNVNPLTLVLEPGADPANKKLAFPPEQFLFAGPGFMTTVLTFDPIADTVRVVFTDPKKKGEPAICDQLLTYGKT